MLKFPFSLVPDVPGTRKIYWIVHCSVISAPISDTTKCFPRVSLVHHEKVLKSSSGSLCQPVQGFFVSKTLGFTAKVLCRNTSIWRWPHIVIVQHAQLFWLHSFPEKNFIDKVSVLRPVNDYEVLIEPVINERFHSFINVCDVVHFSVLASRKRLEFNF